jgi:methylenetetrahydrofolate reductase (NADPH)
LDGVAPLVGQVDAINVPDCQRAILKMSSMAAAKIVQDTLGLDTVWQLTGRDRNVLALQADLMGAWAMGIHTVLALTGDPVAIGDQADVARQVSHVDALRLLELIKTLNQDKDATGKLLPRGGTGFCYGAALNPHRMSREAQRHRLHLKLALGVQFFQTQPVYDLDTLLEINAVLDDLCMQYRYTRPRLLVGIIPPKSGDFARFMNQKIPGIHIPQTLIDQLDRSSSPVEDSIAFCTQLVHQMAPYAGGFHFMPVGIERHAAALVTACAINTLIE